MLEPYLLCIVFQLEMMLFLTLNSHTKYHNKLNWSTGRSSIITSYGYVMYKRSALYLCMRLSFLVSLLVRAEKGATMKKLAFVGRLVFPIDRLPTYELIY